MALDLELGNLACICEHGGKIEHVKVYAVPKLGGMLKGVGKVKTVLAKMDVTIAQAVCQDVNWMNVA